MLWTCASNHNEKQSNRTTNILKGNGSLLMLLMVVSPDCDSDCAHAKGATEPLLRPFTTCDTHSRQRNREGYRLYIHIKPREAKIVALAAAAAAFTAAVDMLLLGVKMHAIAALQSPEPSHCNTTHHSS